MHVLVATIVHHPEDARILHRQIRALLDSGHRVTYLAPFSHCGVRPRFGVTPVDVPRAVGRRRGRALRSARSELREHASRADLLLIHDPELLLALPGRRGRPPTVWDVHEDTAAALEDKPWVPRALRPLLHPSVRIAERLAEHRIHLLLAEYGYRSRFAGDHPVVANCTSVPELVQVPGENRVVHLGHLSHDRGAADLVALARLLRGSGLHLELIGPADSVTEPVIRQAHDAGLLYWYGFVPNDGALALLDGAMAGLSLMHDAPNHVCSRPTKVTEYMAHGLPVVSTPLPHVLGLVVPRHCGTVVPYRAPDAAAKALLRLRDRPELRLVMARRGHAAARMSYHWPDHARAFTRQLEEWSGHARDGGQPGTPVERPRRRMRT